MSRFYVEPEGADDGVTHLHDRAARRAAVALCVNDVDAAIERSRLAFWQAVVSDPYPMISVGPVNGILGITITPLALSQIEAWVLPHRLN